MLRSLYIRDYALIEELEVDFGPGLNIITGETGAGKSIVIGALKMILGERASTEVVRTGARKAIIEGVFDEADTPVINALLEENQIDSGEQIIMRREITASQSRAFINDSPATVQLLKEVAANLIDLHGQHEHQSLLRTETHLQMVDQFGALDGDRREYERRYKEISALELERRSLVAREQDLRQQRDLIAFQINEIDQVDPQPDEETRLRDERRVLENAEQLFEATQGLNEMLYASEQAVQDVLVTARNELRELSGIDPSFSELASEIETAETIVAEVARSLQQYNAGIEFNPERLEEIRLRTMAIEGLKRKYGGALESVIEHRRSIGETYELAADFEGAITRLGERISKARTGLSEAAIALSEKRKEVAARIRKMIEAELGALGMNDARFEVRFDVAVDPNGWVSLADGTNVDARADGIDVAEFYISTNVGETPRPLARVASGGEISRIMLALKSILAKSERLPILVFDEIDTGISGAVARRVGRSMAELARFHQIIAITHLPQIAALGDIHLRVSKLVEDGRTKTYMHRLGERISKARTGLSEAAIALSEKRKEVAARIRKMIEAELGALGMNDARFEVRFDVAVDPNGWVSLADGTNVDARADGIDVAEFYISTNVGETPRPLARVASGGEISRIMLALKSILAKSERLPILVFDEIDTGISGAVARRVGRSMAELARFHQIIAITHLPQIAALGDIHLRVSKLVEDGRTKTYMHRLGDEERAAQVASLIAGGGVTDAALESARELMDGGGRD